MYTMRLTVFALAVAAASAAAIEQAYPPTPPGVMEIKRLPPARAMTAAAEGPYFGNQNTLFRRLFAYIRGGKIAMTTPVVI